MAENEAIEAKQGEDAGQEPEAPQGAAQADTGASKQGAKYTDEDVDAIVAKKFAKWREQEAQKVEEAKRLAEMDATQKAEYERDQLRKELDELKRREAVREMAAESRRQLREKGVDVPDEVVAALVREDAEGTKECIDAFSDAFTAAVEAEVKRRLSGSAPRQGGAAQAPTRESILAIRDTMERQKAIREHPEIFQQ